MEFKITEDGIDASNRSVAYDALRIKKDSIELLYKNIVVAYLDISQVDNNWRTDTLTITGVSGIMPINRICR